MKIVKTDICKNYNNGFSALIDKGYEHIGNIYFTRNFNKIESGLMKKTDNGELYYVLEMIHLNNTVYSVKINKVKNLKGKYNVNIYSPGDIRIEEGAN